jgi:hypothetical protein
VGLFDVKAAGALGFTMPADLAHPRRQVIE